MKLPQLLLALGGAALIALPADLPAASARPSPSPTATPSPALEKPRHRKFPESMEEPEEVPVQTRPFLLTLPRELVLTPMLPTLSSLGITPALTYVTNIAGNISGGKRQGFSYDDNIGASFTFDLQKLFSLQGGTLIVSMSQRDGTSLSQKDVGNVFTIQQIYGGQTFHLIDVAYQQRLFDDHVELSIGRLAAGDDFLVSTYDYLFMQNGFDGNPVGIFFNAPGMTAYPNASWGARIKLWPTDSTYFMAGIYNGDPSIRANEYHGADFSMDGPAFAIAEVGYQRDGLMGDPPYLGNYKLGAWYDDNPYTDYRNLGTASPTLVRGGNWGLYGLFDQVVLAWGDPGGNSGLGLFGSLLASPDQSVSRMPYFCTGGIVARGISQSRPRDIVGFGAIFGQFSGDLSAGQDRQQLLDPSVVVQRNETALELTYRYSMWDGGCFIQPDLQYIIHPGGAPQIQNALVLGCQIGIDF